MVIEWAKQIECVGEGLMKSQLQLRQRGMTMMGMLITVIILGILAVAAIRVIPVLTEYQTVSKVARFAASSSTEAEVRSRFDTQIRMEGVTSPPITGNDLKITNAGSNRTTVSFSYDKVIPIVGSYSYTIHFSDSQTAGTQR